ncbi:MAG TPA: hypothetical protein PKH06_03410 [Candidatus Dojkabacteria bacterium]|nr:hypothetical protein [Candidatus Dojkabacteria bacterium]HNW23777.1 hypothetical protein [Candidatus Dojkabacteria bacterium]
MNLVKYLIAGGVALLLAVFATFMGNIWTGILVFVGLLGGYIMWNILKNITPESAKEDSTPPKETPTPPMDN